MKRGKERGVFLGGEYIKTNPPKGRFLALSPAIDRSRGALNLAKKLNRLQMFFNAPGILYFTPFQGGGSWASGANNVVIWPITPLTMRFENGKSRFLDLSPEVQNIPHLFHAASWSQKKVVFTKTKW